MLLSDRGVLASTLRAGQTPWRSREEWRRAGGRTDRSTVVDIGVQRYAAREVVLAERPSLSAVSSNRAMKRSRRSAASSTGPGHRPAVRGDRGGRQLLDRPHDRRRAQTQAVLTAALDGGPKGPSYVRSFVGQAFRPADGP